MTAKKSAPVAAPVVTVTVVGSYDRREDQWVFRTVAEDYEPTEFEVSTTVDITIEV